MSSTVAVRRPSATATAARFTSSRVRLLVGEIEPGAIGDAQPVGEPRGRSVFCRDPFDGDDVARLQAATIRQAGSELPDATRAWKLEQPMLDGVLVAFDIKADVRMGIHPLHRRNRPRDGNWLVDVEHRLDRVVGGCGEGYRSHRRHDQCAGESSIHGPVRPVTIPSISAKIVYPLGISDL